MIASQPCRLTTGDWGLGTGLGFGTCFGSESFSNTSIISAGRHRANKTLTRLFLHMKTIYIYDSIFQPCRTTTGGEWGLGTGHPGTVFFRTFPKSVDTKNFVTASQPCSGNDRFHCSNQRVVFERPRSARFPLDDNTSQRRLLSAPRRSKTSFFVSETILFTKWVGGEQRTNNLTISW